MEAMNLPQVGFHSNLLLSRASLKVLTGNIFVDLTKANITKGQLLDKALFMSV